MFKVNPDITCSNNILDILFKIKILFGYNLSYNNDTPYFLFKSISCISKLKPLKFPILILQKNFTITLFVNTTFSLSILYYQVNIPIALSCMESFPLHRKSLMSTTCSKIKQANQGSDYIMYVQLYYSYIQSHF